MTTASYAFAHWAADLRASDECPFCTDLLCPFCRPVGPMSQDFADGQFFAWSETLTDDQRSAFVALTPDQRSAMYGEVSA